MTSTGLLTLFLFFCGFTSVYCIAKRQASGFGIVFYSLAGGVFLVSIAMIILVCVGSVCAGWEYIQ
ncbi:hypothetical protein GCM10007875_16320 [Limnobacter litoralis]|uniref:Uncharacterized protein n=1 Tax=Limnobacter litoralis TaxID=481366 RepID=A0ABQ5YSZ3_9BURK|nr:hypothetical protein GCM10007875_16320 [Limnobacter litoralis]